MVVCKTDKLHRQIIRNDTHLPADCHEGHGHLCRTFTSLPQRTLMAALRALPCVCYLCASFNVMCLVGLEHTAALVTIQSNVKSMHVSTKWFGEKNVKIHGGSQHVKILYELIREIVQLYQFTKPSKQAFRVASLYL